MGYAKLNIWVRDQNCKPFNITQPNTGDLGDYVEIYDLQGNRVGERVYLSKGIAHTEVQVPPGCYKVTGHICEPSIPQQPAINEFANWAMVIAGCNQEVCVNLIVPSLQQCVRDNLFVFVRAAQQARVPDQSVAILSSTMATIGNIPPPTMSVEIESAITEMKQKKVSPERVKEYERVLKVFKEMK